MAFGGCGSNSDAATTQSTTGAMKHEGAAMKSHGKGMKDQGEAMKDQGSSTDHMEG